MNERGNITVIFALFLPALMALCMLVVDGGTVYLRKAQLYALASSAGEYLLSTVADHMTQLAETECAPDCEDASPLSLLSEESFMSLIESPFSTYVEGLTETFIKSNDPRMKLGNSGIEVEYPFGWQPGQTALHARIALNDSLDPVFGKLFGTGGHAVTETVITELLLH